MKLVFIRVLVEIIDSEEFYNLMNMMFMFIKFSVIFGAREAFVAVRTLYGVLHRRPGTPRRAARREGPYSGTGKVWFAEVSTRF